MTILWTTKVKEAEYTKKEIGACKDREPHKLGDEGLIVTQPAPYVPEAAFAPTQAAIPVGTFDHNKQMIDSIPHPPTRRHSPPAHPETPQLAEKEQDEETRIMKIMAEMIERVTFRVTACISNDVTRLTHKLTTTNTPLQKVITQLAALLHTKHKTAANNINQRKNNAAPSHTTNTNTKTKISYVNAAASAILNDDQFTTVTKKKKKKTAHPFINPEYIRLNRQVVIETSGPTPDYFTSDYIL